MATPWTKLEAPLRICPGEGRRRSVARYFSISGVSSRGEDWKILSTSKAGVASSGSRSAQTNDPFDKLSSGEDDRRSGKFGRSSFPPREQDMRDFSARDRPRSSSFSRDSSRSSSSSYRSSYDDTRERGYSRRSDGFSDSPLHRGGSASAEGRTYDATLSQRGNGSPSQNMSPDHDYLYSPNVVIPALQNGFRTPYKLYYSHTLIQNRKKRKEDPVADCIALATKAGVKVVKTDKHQLNELSGQRPHQGVILEASKLKEIFVNGLGPVSIENRYDLNGKTSDVTFKNRDDEPPVWIALDEVVDPQNLGAILRTSLFLGVDGVVVCHKNSAPFSGVVAKASAGALEARPTYGVSSLQKFIKQSQENGWHVVGAHATHGSKRSRPLHTWPDTGVDQPTILVMGNEGNGLRKQIMDLCDSFIQVPSMSTLQSNVDSLNVSVATGVILSKLMGGRFLHLPKNLKKYPMRSQYAHGKESTGDDQDSEDEVDMDEDQDDQDDEDEDDDDSDEKESNDLRKSKQNKSIPF
ncbi:hypothetical protein KVV02_000462 [Mortierella alpina]|uniref:rRNA methyltransferase 1, mitochondrial n=1 Tax=Mortierella alpina TaxID=64518 RepID=A0A9P8I9A0_MORAP|nr:hypothetical protein KVV02_000462 [Mortierella alpina]